MYLSHPVRHLRDDPIAGESASLVVELTDDEDYDDLVSTVTDLGGTVERDLGFSAHLLTLPQTAIDTLCDFDGIARIETADTISLVVDADVPAQSDEE